jgi:hypothetical protein
MPRPATPTMDLTHGMTFATRILSNKVTPQGKHVLSAYRMALRRAEKFVVDDESVALICGMSHQMDRLASFAFLARLPFDTCWFELSLHAKVREFERMKTMASPFVPSEVAERIGYLLYKDDDGSDSPRWVATQFYQHNGAVMPGLISFIFDPEGSDYDPVRGSKRWRAPTLSLLPNFPRMKVELKTSPPQIIETDVEYLLAGDVRLDLSILGSEWVANRVAAIVDPFWQTILSKRSQHEMYHTLLVEIKEEAGHLRWLMTLLAAVNNLPKETRHMVVPPGGRTFGAHVLPYFQHRTIAIQVPRENHVAWARDYIDGVLRHNAPRAWHKVRGHWRVIEYGKSTRMCRHMPTMVEEGVGICERCELLIRWIPEMERGDASIGMIEHTYNVTKG